MARRKRSGAISVTVDAYVDSWEVLEQLEDDDLLDEVAKRKLSLAAGTERPDMEIVREAYDELMCGRYSEAIAALRGIIFPKWGSIELCKTQYEAALGKR